MCEWQTCTLVVTAVQYDQPIYQHCFSAQDDHQCEFPSDHTDAEYDGSHQCQCGEVW